MYKPNYWCVIDTGHCYKLFGSWSGSYLSGASWRLNSGITSVEEDDDYYYFNGHSRSVYKCRKDNYGCHVGSLGILNTFLTEATLMPSNTDWMKLND